MKIRGNTIGTPIKPEKNILKATDLTAEEQAKIRKNIGADQVFIAEYGVTTFAELEEAFNAGKLIYLRYNNDLIALYNLIKGNSANFYQVSPDRIFNYNINASTNSWGLRGHPLCATKHTELDNRITALEGATGDIETALDAIIAIQEELIGGDGE